MSEPSRHWVCAACERVHEVEPLRCVGCGGLEFVAVATVPTLEQALGLRVTADTVVRSAVSNDWILRKR